jgi:hypothetical protein
MHRISAFHQDLTFNHRKVCFRTSITAADLTTYSMAVTPTFTFTFTLFPKLPAELQFKIWGDTLLGPKVVTISLKHGYNRRSRPATQCQVSKTPTHLLSILHTCHASRTVALKRYRLTFEKQLRHPICFDFNNDLLHLSSYETATKFFVHASKSPLAAADQNLIQRLAVNGGRQFIKAEELPELTALRDLFLSEFSMDTEVREQIMDNCSNPKSLFPLFRREWKVCIAGLTVSRGITGECTREVPRLVLASLGRLKGLVERNTRTEWSQRGIVWN